MQMFQDKSGSVHFLARHTRGLFERWTERFHFVVKVWAEAGVIVCVCMCIKLHIWAQVQKKREVGEDWRGAVDVQCSHP